LESQTAPPGDGRHSRRDYRAQVGAIRRSRLHPRRTDHLYFHLRRLLDDLRAAIADLDARDVLDVYCGARPYEPLFPPETNYVGLDIDDAFGCADVVSHEFLPFPDASFDLCLCTQAFYFLSDPHRAIDEFARVLRPQGHVVITVPVVYPGTERLYTPLQLQEAFAGWEDVEIVANGGTVVSLVTLTAFLVHQGEKRLPRALGALFALFYSLLNVAGEAADAGERRFLSSVDTLPANLLLRAARPARTT
jgi:SAM-dependent methyltransferase